MALDALQDKNQVYTALFARGTLGTADILGTSGVVAGAADPETGAQYVYNLGPAGTTSVTGTNPASYMPVRLTDGTTFYTATGGGASTGTVDLLKAGTITRIEGGTIGLITRVGNLGTLEVGTVTVTNPTGTTIQFNNGTIDLLKSGTVIVNNGTASPVKTEIYHSGAVMDSNNPIPVDIKNVEVTVDTNTTIRVTGTAVTNNYPFPVQLRDEAGAAVGSGNGLPARVENGTVSLLQAGTISRVEGGTIGLVSRVGNVGTLEVGTISSLPNIPGGTLTALANGTVTAGTLTRVGNVGTVELGTVRINPRPTRDIITYGTTSVGTIGTILSAPGVGTSIYIESLEVSVQSGTVEPCVSFGLQANGQGVLTRGLYPALGGVQKTFSRGVNGGTTNAPLTWNVLTSSGTISYIVAYWIE